MLRFITGLPRTGKTYYAVNEIYTKFMNVKSSEYKKHHYLYTNIGGLKFDQIQLALSSEPIDTDDDVVVKKAIELDWSKVYHHLKKAYELSQSKKTDDEIVLYLQEKSLSPAVFYIDECYHFFKKRSDPVLIWWLAYHGHLAHDINLMLQNKDLISSEYQAFTEVFIDAQPKSLSFSNNVLRYYFYASPQYIPQQRYDSTTLKTDQKVFDLYKSGDVHKPKKVLTKYYLLLAIMVIFAVYSVSKLLFFRDSSDVLNTKTEKDVSEDVKKQTGKSKEYIVDVDSTLVRVRCDDRACWLVTDKYQRYEYPIKYFKFVLARYEIPLMMDDVLNTYEPLVPGETGLVSQSVTYFKDYWYEIPSNVKNKYFSLWFDEIPDDTPLYQFDAKEDETEQPERLAGPTAISEGNEA
jgi:zona occludens toxin